MFFDLANRKKTILEKLVNLSNFFLLTVRRQRFTTRVLELIKGNFVRKTLAFHRIKLKKFLL